MCLSLKGGDCIASLEEKIGQKYGRLTVIEEAPPRIGKGGVTRRMLRCQCDCGKIIEARADGVGYHTFSCGCLQREKSAEAGHKRAGIPTRHGESRERLRNIWYLMKYRCEVEGNQAWKNYGGRGIKVCDEWSSDPDGYFRFKQWALDNGYTPELTIDRVDNDKDYSPDNCKWSTSLEQANNKRSNLYLEYKGETHTPKEWADILNMPVASIYNRLELGWTVERALSQPLRKHPNRNKLQQ